MISVLYRKGGVYLHDFCVISMCNISNNIIDFFYVIEMPVTEKPALFTQSSETTSLSEPGTPVELGTFYIDHSHVNTVIFRSRQ